MLLLLHFSALAAGTGLAGKYYTNTTFSGTAVSRTDTNINFTWPGSPIAGVGSNNFSVAWTGQIEPAFTELYTFYVTADDAVRLWVDDQCLLARSFYQSNGELRAQIRLKAGHRVNFRVEFIEFTGNASVKVEWSSSSLSREVVPMTRLYPTTEIPNGGAVRMEIWTNLPGTGFATLTNGANYPNKPAMREFLTAFECLATNWETNYGTRVTGLLRAPTNGNYTFAVSGNDAVQLFLSTTTNASAKSLIASVTNATAFREWTHHAPQISAPVALAAGQRCYVELLHKQGTNGDHWSVGWMKPGETNFSIIPGTVLMQPAVDTAQPSTANFFDTLATEQPRLGATRARFTWLKQQYQSPNASAVKTRAQSVVSLANSDLTATPTTQRQAQDRIQRLAMAWWVTGNSNYAEAAWHNISNSIVNGDWGNPWKGVEDGVVAIGYDWLYPYWSQARKNSMTNAMVAKGFGPGWTDSYANNIGVIINAGHLLATLAVGTGSESVAESKLGSAIGRLNSKIDKWNANAGAWYEGTDYGIFTKWGFAPAMMGMETALGSTWGVSRIRGVSATAREPLSIASNTRQRFTFSDVGTGSENPMGWANWWARRFDAPEVFDFSRQVGNSAFNALLVPETTISPASSGLPPDCAFRGPADSAGGYFQEVVTLRENWSDTKATFVGGMGGTATYGHAALQSGTFQLCARGVNWFVDLKSESYDVPNHNTTTPNPNGADRWDYYRWRAEGHNCLIVNPTANPDRIWNAPYAPLIAYQSAPNGQRSFAIWDLSKNITGVSKVQRGIQLFSQRKQVLIQDEIVHPSPTTCWWFAHFNASVTTSISGDGSSVTLTSGSERLWGKIVSGGGVWTVRDALPLPTSPAPSANANNSAYKKLAIQLTGVTNRTVAVWFVPLAPGENPPTNSPAITPLNTWSLTAQNEAPVTRSGGANIAGTSTVDVDLRSYTSDDWTPGNHLTYSVANPTGGTVSLLPDGFTARFTLTPGSSGIPGFEFTATDEEGGTSTPGTIVISASPVVSTWISTNGGNWTTAGNWLENSVPAGGRGADIRFFPGQSLPSGTIAINNGLAGTLDLNQLQFSGTGTSATVVNLTGNPLRLVRNGTTSPAITLSGVTAGFRYNIAHPITLDDDVVFNANNSGTFVFTGAITGNGGLTRTGTYSTLILAGTNTYSGPTTIGSGTLQIGNDGASGTLGTGPVVNNSELRIDRTGTVDIPNDISGTGAIRIHCPSINDVVRLAGDNTFTGEVQITSGSLRVTNAAQLGIGAKRIVINTVSAALRLNGAADDVMLPPEWNMLTSNENGAIYNEAGSNVIDGPITLTSGGGVTRIICSNGTLTLNGTITPSTTGRTLDLRGAGSGVINGNILDGTATNTLSGITKADAGRWTLNGSNSFTGGTTLSGGSLFINGTHGTGAVSVSSGATLGGMGRILAPLTVNGTLSPGDGFGTLHASNSIAFGSTARLRWELGTHSASGDRVTTTGAATLTAGARIDVVLDAAGSKVNFLNSFWRSARSFAVLDAASVTGAFVLGTVSADAGGRPAATYGSFTVQHTATGVNLLWTPVPGFPWIDDPTVALLSPTHAFVSLRDSATRLRLVGSASNASSNAVAWTAVSGPGPVMFADAGALDTSVLFPADGTYVLRLTATNEVGSASTNLTVNVNPATSIALRHGDDGLAHPATFLRSDATNRLTWNSGARDQVLVGNNDTFRSILAFDLSGVDTSVGIASVTLDFWTSSAAGSGSVGAIDLHPLTTAFVEGIGTSSSDPAEGTGSGADWNTHDGVNDWDTPGGDYEAPVLATVAGFNATTTRVLRRFNSTTGLVAAVSAFAGSEASLNLLLRSGASAAGNFARLGSNDDAPEYRPLLTITYAVNFVPGIDPGSVPTAVAGVAAPLVGTTIDASAARWSKLSGPGGVTFAQAALPTTTVTFSVPGTHVLRLTASNSHGEASRDLVVNVGTNTAAFANWQAAWWPGVTNTAIIGLNANPDGDVLANLIEFATGTSPVQGTGSVGLLALNAGLLEFTYRRSHAALAAGFAFIVEWSDTLGNDWTTAGVTQTEVPGSDDGTASLWQATVPAGTSGKRFVRVRIVQP
jgi:autotransporter-associated beta strand protein